MTDPKTIVLAPEAGIDLESRLAALEDILETAEQNRQAALSENTRKAYASQWNAFFTWCNNMGLPPFPADSRVVLAYLTDRQRKGAAESTLGQAYAAIREEHRMRGAEPPALDGQLYRSWLGARKQASRGREVDKAAALSPAALRDVVRHCRGPLGDRDRALLLVGWCGAMRSEEIAGLNVGDLKITDEGLRVKIRHSKTDQMGAGHEIGIARASDQDACPVAAWEALLAGRHSPADESPAFTSKNGHRLCPKDIGLILKRRMKQAGLSRKGFSGHSLRSGCITAAAEAGHSLEAIQRQSRHKSLEVLLGYIRTATLFKGNVTEGLL